MVEFFRNNTPATMSPQTNYTYVSTQIKKIKFWLAAILGGAFCLTTHQEILTKIPPSECLQIRVAAYTFVFFLIAIALSLFLHKVIPRFAQFTRSQKMGIFTLSAITPLILAVAILDKDFFNKTFHLLLPNHNLQIMASPDSLQNGQSVILTTFKTQAQGVVDLNTLKIKGWTISKNQLVLTDPTNNLISWEGQTGGWASLNFAPRSDPLKLKTQWDETSLNYKIRSSINKNIEAKKEFNIPFYAGWFFVAIAEYISAAFVMFYLSVILAAFPGFTPAATRRQNGDWLIYALPMYTIWIFYLLVFWPGFMSPDSMNQWEQIITGQFTHANPVAHTLTMWLITRLWFSPAAVALFQVLALGGILGWGIATLRELGVPGWLAWMTAIALALSPANSVLSITLWKDIPFSAAVVALTILMLRIIATKGKWLGQDRAWLLLGITLGFIGLYRLNGLFVGLINLAIIGLIYGDYWKSALKTAILFLVIYFAVTGPIFNILNVRIVNMARDELVVAHLLAGHMKAETSVVSENKELLLPAMPQYPWPYTCYRNSPLLFYSDLNRNYLVEHSGELLLLALKATWQNPLETLEHFACQGASVYRIPQEYPNEMMTPGIQENDHGLEASSLLPRLYLPLSNFINKYINNWEHNSTWLVWRMPFWMYLSVFGCVIFCIRSRNWKPFIILLPGLITVLPFVVLTLGQIFRYVYSMYLIGILVSGYFLTCAIERDGGGN